MSVADSVSRQQGRSLTMAAIGGTVTLFVATHLILGFEWRRVWLFEAAMGLVGVHLYRGSRWARWPIGMLLLMVGLAWGHRLLTDSGTGRPWRGAVFAVLIVGILAVGTAVMTSRSISVFLAQQRQKRSVLVSQCLRALWIAVLGATGVWIGLDLVGAL